LLKQGELVAVLTETVYGLSADAKNTNAVKKRIYPTEEGAPQGGIISPTLTLMALSGLERLIKENFKKKDKVNVGCLL